MANALKTLFTDIATAIRETLPDEPSMSPYNYPDKIRKVASTGGGTRTFVYKQGYVTATSETTTTVQHDSGVIPDIIIVSPKSIITDAGYLIHYIGYSEKFMNALGEDAVGGYLTAIMSTGSAFHGTIYDAFDVNNSELFGRVRNVTTTTFDIGSDSAQLVPSAEYMWITIGDIV